MKLLTMNLNYDGAQHGPWNERRAIITQAIRDTQPDIIALQAVARVPGDHDGLDQAAQLARELPEYNDAVFQTITRHDDGREEGLAFLSRHAILDTRAHLLSLREGLEDTSKRLLLHGRFETPAGELHVFNGHFSWVEAQALDNIAEVLPHLGWVEGPAALLGDFNQTPDSATVQQLRDAGWVDAWRAVKGTEDGFTFVENGALVKRIDYVMLNAQLAPRLRDATVIADQGGAVRASDHAGVLVTLDD